VCACNRYPGDQRIKLNSVCFVGQEGKLGKEFDLLAIRCPTGATLSVQGLIYTILLEQHVLVRLQEIYVWLISPLV